MHNQKAAFELLKGVFWAGYTSVERSRFVFHVTLAVVCLPFYYLFPFRFGLVTAPYLFFLAMRPKSEYLLPVVIHFLYGSQQRFFFCLGCFLYVLFHFVNLRRHSLHWLYLFYMLLLPYFAWFFWQKLSMPRSVAGVGDVLGGLFSHFVFSTMFWAALVVKRTGRPFFRGMVVLSFALLLVMSVVGGGASLDVSGTGEGLDHTVFSRYIFWAMPFLVASFVYCQFSRESGYALEKTISLAGCALIVLDFFHLTKCDVTFTLFGLCWFAGLMTFCAIKWSPRVVLMLTPLPLFAASAYIVLQSPTLIEKYGGINAGEGDYKEMSMTSVDSVLKKLQRKAVDDRAVMWALTIKYIKRDILQNPIWVKPVPYMEVDVEGEDAGKRYTAFFAVGSHNTMLNLIRFYGFYGGLGLYLLYVWCFCRKDNRRALSTCSRLPVVVVMSVCIAQGVIGGHTGHYVVGIAMGSALFACLGACWGEMHELHRRMRQNKLVKPSDPCLPESPRMRGPGGDVSA